MNSTIDKHIEFRELEHRKIKIPVLKGGDFQRDPQDHWAQKIVDEYDPLVMDPINVAFIDGDYWCWEGDHRLMALRRLGHATAMCKIAYGYALEEIALAFALQGKRRRNVGKKDSFRALLVAKVPRYTAALETIRHYGFDLDMSRGRSCGSDGPRLTCHGAITGIIEHNNGAGLPILDTALRVIARGWGEGVHFRGDTLVGISEFIRKNAMVAPMPVGRRDYFESRLIQVLAEHPEVEINRKARELTADRGGVLPDRIPVALAYWYNAGLRTNRIPT